MTIELSVALSRRFGDEVHSEETFGTLTVDVPPRLWVAALTFARDDLACGFFDWLTAVDELEDGFAVVAHVYSLDEGRHLLVRTRVPREDPRLPTATGVYRGANWHERETFEMFGVLFDGHPDLKPLLLPDGFEGHPLRKDFVLAARVAKPWPGAKEPGESASGAPSRRRMLPPGVPADWGPAAAAREAAPDRPARRTPAERPARRAPADRPRRRVAGDPHASVAADEPPKPAGTPGESRGASGTTGEPAEPPGEPDGAAERTRGAAGEPAEMTGEPGGAAEGAGPGGESRGPAGEPAETAGEPGGAADGAGPAGDSGGAAGEPAEMTGEPGGTADEPGGDTGAPPQRRPVRGISPEGDEDGDV